MELSFWQHRARLKRLVAAASLAQPLRTSEEAYAQMERSLAFDRQTRNEDVRALALEHEERALLAADVVEGQAQDCNYCGCCNPSDSCKCDDCGYDLPAFGVVGDTGDPSPGVAGDTEADISPR